MSSAASVPSTTGFTIPYGPGYRDAVRSWLAYLWAFWRKVVVWWLVIPPFDVFLVTMHGVDWFVLLSAAAWVVLGFGLVMPLLLRLLWAYKIPRLGIHELEISREGLVTRGMGIDIVSPWRLYRGFRETKHYFLLESQAGFSFIPKRPLGTPDRAAAVRALLEDALPEGEGRR